MGRIGTGTYLDRQLSTLPSGRSRLREPLELNGLPSLTADERCDSSDSKESEYVTCKTQESKGPDGCFHPHAIKSAFNVQKSRKFNVCPCSEVLSLNDSTVLTSLPSLT